jgi:hypothetical protein
MWLVAVEQTLSNWVRAHGAGTLKEVTGSKAAVTAEQMEISRLGPSWRGSRWSATFWEKRRHTLQRARSEVCLYLRATASLADLCAVPGAAGERVRFSPTPGPAPTDRSLPAFE